jgi:S1-C subfamily serine protease
MPIDEPPARPKLRQRLSALVKRHPAPATIAASAAVTLFIVALVELASGPQRNLTQNDITDAVEFALSEQPRAPSIASVAYQAIIPSVVRVTGYDPRKQAEEEAEAQADGKEVPSDAPADGETGETYHERFMAVGTGVVIDDNGTVLTNLHVARAAPRLRVTFADGTESDAFIIGSRAALDLAILRPRVLPDDLMPATLGTTGGLAPGDDVVVVGFPFGIGPSASAGVVSGLDRTIRPEKGPPLSGLIQFDAAANPGNSGGPLVNADGEVLGIVTGILNPSGVRTFAGIGFAVTIESASGAVEPSPL